MCHHRFIFFVCIHLLLCHGHEEVFVLSFRQLDCHIRFSAANKARGNAVAYFIEIAITHHFTQGGLNDVAITEIVERRQAILVDQFHHRIQFFELVFQGRTGKRHHIFCIHPARRNGNLRVPIFETLHLVENENVGVDVAGVAHIVVERVIRHYFVGHIHVVKFSALHNFALNHQGFSAHKALNFAFPLIFKRIGACHNHRFGKRIAAQHLGSGNGLDGFTQTHFVGNHRAPFFHGKTHALHLIREEAGAEQMVEHIVGQGFRQGLAHLVVAASNHIAEGIVVAAKGVGNLFGFSQESGKPIDGIGQKAHISVEIIACQPGKRLRIFAANAKHHLATVHIGEIHRRVGRNFAAQECGMVL